MNPELRYERLAGDLAAMIENGVLGPGERLPSVRRLARWNQAYMASRFSREKPWSVGPMNSPTWSGAPSNV